jgi:hypothetical protein
MAPIVLALALLAAPSDVTVDFDHDADFSTYATFDWSPAQTPAENPANHVRIVRAVEQELQAKGLRKATDGAPGIFVHYYAKVEAKLKSQAGQERGTWAPNDLRTTVDFSRVKQGTLMVELIDGKSRDVVWRGVIVAAAPRPDLQEEAIFKAVKRLFADYPPKAEASPAP